MTTKRAPHRYAALAALAVCCPISACSTGETATPAAPPPPPSALAPTSVPAEPSPPPSSPSAPDAPRNVPPSEARDGTNTAACRTGQCQVAIRLPAKLRIGSYTVALSLNGDQVEMRMNYPDGTQGTINFGQGGSGSFQAAGGQGFEVRLLGLTGNTAVLDVTKQ